MGLKQLLIDADASQFIQSTGEPFEQRDIPYGESYQAFQTPSSPLIIKRFQKNDNRVLPGIEQETNSTVGLVNQVTDSFLRGGAITAGQRAIVDAERIGKFLLTPKGLAWAAANVALQRTNPKNVTSPRNRTFTPLNIGLQVPANIAGIHIRRDGIVDLDFESGYNYDENSGGRKYEKRTRDEGDNTTLVDLTNSKIIKSSGTSVIGNAIGGLLGNLGGIGEFIQNVVDNNSNDFLLEYSGGAHSVFGIGQTRIKRYGPFVVDDNKLHPTTVGFTNLGLGMSLPSIVDFRLKKKVSAQSKYLGNEVGGKVLPNTNYKKHNLETQYGIGNPGSPALKNQPYNAAYNAGTVDKINMSDIMRRSNLEEPSKVFKDLIKFRIAVVDTENPLNDNVMLFRAFLTNFSDGYTGDWGSFKYNGRAENFYIYNGFDRKISFDFKIAAQSRYEMIPLYRKLNYLVAQTAPEYKNRRMRGVFSRLTIGDWCNELPGFFSSVNLSVDTSTPWEIRMDEKKDADMNELPMVVNVSCNFTPVHNFAPENRIDSPFILPEINVESQRQWHRLNGGEPYELRTDVEPVKPLAPSQIPTNTPEPTLQIPQPNSTPTNFTPSAGSGLGALNQEQALLDELNNDIP